MSNPKRKQVIDNILKSFDRVVIELRGTRITDDEFNAITKRMLTVMHMLNTCQEEHSAESKQKFNEAMKWLRSIRK